VTLHLPLPPPPPPRPLLPYTTLFRSPFCAARGNDRLRAAVTAANSGTRSENPGMRPSLAGSSRVRQVHRVRGATRRPGAPWGRRSEEHTSELQSRENLVCRLLLEKKN